MQMLPEVGDCTVHVPRRSLAALSRNVISAKDLRHLPVAQMVFGHRVKLQLRDDLGRADWERLQQEVDCKTGHTAERIDFAAAMAM